MRPNVSVVISAYTEDRWHDLLSAVGSVERQSRPASEIIVVADHNRSLLERARAELNGVIAIENTDPRGLAGARNSGVTRSTGDIIAFLDDDAEADAEWLERLVEAYDDPSVAGVGGSIEPWWLEGKPASFPEEFNWVVGCSYRGLPERRSQVRNMIGANMSFRREVFERAGLFETGIGRIGTRPVGCEETELCIRALQRSPGSVFVYEPQAAVRHRVPAARAGWGYFRSRCYAEGLSKAIVSERVGPQQGLATERAYALRTLPRGVLRGIGDAVVRRDPPGLARAAAIVAGVSITIVGYLVGRSRRLVAKPMKRADSAHAGSSAADAWIEFDIHGVASMRVSSQAPTAAQLRDMFAPFVSEGLDRHDLTVTTEALGLEQAAHADSEYRYTPSSVRLNDTDIEIVVEDGGFRLSGSRELLTTVLPLIDRVLVTRDVAMIHAATVDYRGHGVCLPAWGGTGKTSTISKLLRIDGVSFMGDDWAFLAADGRLLGYEKPMLIKPYQRSMFPHLFKSKRKPLAPSALLRPVGKLATLLHPVLVQYPRLARMLRRWSPEHLTVPPRDAFPEARFSAAAPLAATIFVERTDAAETVMEARDSDWMVSRLIGNFHAEITPHSQEVVTALGATGLVPIERSFADKAAVLARALAGKPSYLLQVPTSLSADEASDVMVEKIREALAREGIRWERDGGDDGDNQ